MLSRLYARHNELFDNDLINNRNYSMLKKPAVFVFGWLGAKMRHVNTVADFYKHMDVEVIPYVQQPASLLNIKQDEKAFKRMYEQALNRPVFCHMFSMNGSSTFYKTFADKYMRLKSGIDLKALIMDSTPGRIDRDLYHRAFSKAIFPKSKILSAATNIALTPVFDTFLFLSKSHRKETEMTVKALFNNPVKVPTLMLASKKDELIRFGHMMEYADRAKQAGVEVHTKFWSDSGHVRLYKDHPTEYVELVQSFAKRFLNNKC